MKILLIDDDKLFLKMVENILTENKISCEFFTCSNAGESLELIKKENFDLVLLDIFLPGLCGLDILKEIRKKDKNIQVLTITASNNKNVLKKSFELGANDYILKPLEEIEFIARLQSAIRTRIEYLARLEAERALKQSEEMYRSFVEKFQGITFKSKPFFEVVFIHGAVEEITGYTEEELTKSVISWEQIVHPDDLPLLSFDGSEFLFSPNYCSTLEYRIVRKDERIRWVSEIVQNSCDEKGNVVSFEGIILDITNRKVTEAKLKYLSFHDQLTGLYNRAYFEEELKKLQFSRDYPITIICIDLDGLKLVNDTMGHKQGDELLKACTAVLKRSVRVSDLAVRIGGDEFVVILPKTNEETAQKIVERIRFNAARFRQRDLKIPFSFSLGMATNNSPATQSLQDTFNKADNMMYKDKLYSSFSTRNQTVEILLASLSERDYLATGHARRLKYLCRRLGEKAVLSRRQLADLELLAQVHDLGKVAIPKQILFKKAPLTEEDWEIIRQHPAKGYRIACHFPVLSLVADLILCHHERWDGSGYPLKLKGEEIPLECRVLTIVDSFDAMTNQRSYNKVKTQEEAVAELKRCAGTQFELQLVNLFVEILEEEGENLEH